MSSKFLYSAPTTDLTTLQDGNFNLKVASATIDELTPNQYVKTDTDGKLVSAGTSSISPLTANLDIATFDVISATSGLSLNAINTTSNTLQVKTQHITADVSSTIIDSSLEAGSFKKTGGTNIQYLMGDGSTLTQSANSGNSNFYLYRSDTSQSITPANGNITYNNATQSNATIIYISHLTRDAIDIEVFFKQISSLSEVYIQDQNLSESFLQFNVIGTPTITATQKVAVPVSLRTAGVGITGFPDGHQVLLSFFTNNLEVDTRLSALETKTSLITNNITYTSFSGTNGITTNKIVVNAKTADDILLGNGTTTSLLTQTNRISTLETKTQNMTAIAGTTTYTGTLLTDKTTFTNNQELVSKLYADNLISNIPVVDNPNIQYITSSGNLSTGLSSSLTLIDGTIYNPVSTDTQLSSGFLTGPSTRGFGFTLLNPITITRIGVPTSHAIVSSSVNFRIYSLGGTFLYAYVIPKTKIYNGYYVLDIPSLTLPASNYRLGVSLVAGDRWATLNPVSNIESRITILHGCYSNSADVFPEINGGANAILSAMFWINDMVQSTLTVNGGIALNGLANLDVENWGRPFIGMQFIHNNANIATLSNSPFTVLGNNFIVSPFSITNNATRQLCCVISTPSGSADGTTTGAVSTSLVGVRVLTAYPFGLVASFNIADTGVFQPNNCQNFIGLWNVAPAIILNQTTQLSVQRNMICFGSNTLDANLCIYTAGPLNTVRQVNLGAYFPANRPALTVSADWYKLALYWDGNVVYYRAINTLYPTIPAANISGFFIPLASDMPPTTTAMQPQILRIMGTPSGAAQGKLQIQRFGIML